VELEPDIRAVIDGDDAPTRRESSDEGESPTPFIRSDEGFRRVESGPPIPYRDAKDVGIDRHGELDRIIGGVTSVPDRVRDQLAREEHGVVQHLPGRFPSRRLADEPTRLDERCRTRGDDLRTGWHSPPSHEVGGRSDELSMAPSLDAGEPNILRGMLQVTLRLRRDTVRA
jgi:hypothetical protein